MSPSRHSPGSVAGHGAGRALVTGASSGIGAEFARQLARRGWSLILVARRRVRLEDLAAELRAAGPGGAGSPEIEVLVADLAEDAGLAAVEARIAGAGDLGLLVNNAGFGIAGDFVDAPPGAAREIARVNVEAVLRLTAAALPILIARGSGGVVNVASMAGFVAGWTPAYGATKAFQINFSRSLSAQVAPRGVVVQALCPGYTRTEFHASMRGVAGSRPRAPAWLWSSPEQVVRASLGALDRGRPVVVVPGVWYKLGKLLADLGLGRAAGRVRNRLHA